MSSRKRKEKLSCRQPAAYKRRKENPRSWSPAEVESWVKETADNWDKPSLHNVADSMRKGSVSGILLEDFEWNDWEEHGATKEIYQRVLRPQKKFLFESHSADTKQSPIYINNNVNANFENTNAQGTNFQGSPSENEESELICMPDRSTMENRESEILHHIAVVNTVPSGFLDDVVVHKIEYIQLPCEFYETRMRVVVTLSHTENEKQNSFKKEKLRVDSKGSSQTKVYSLSDEIDSILSPARSRFLGGYCGLRHLARRFDMRDIKKHTTLKKFTATDYKRRNIRSEIEQMHKADLISIVKGPFETVKTVQHSTESQQADVVYIPVLKVVYEYKNKEYEILMNPLQPESICEHFGHPIDSTLNGADSLFAAIFFLFIWTCWDLFSSNITWALWFIIGIWSLVELCRYQMRLVDAKKRRVKEHQAFLKMGKTLRDAGSGNMASLSPSATKFANLADDYDDERERI